MTTVFFSDPRTDAHTWPDHLEHAGRRQAIARLLEESGVLARLDARQPVSASDEQLLTVHTPEVLALLERIERERRPLFYDADTYLVPATNLAARLSAGATIQAVDAVLEGGAENALVAMRPPGHHALPGQPMGFCVLSNVALAARHARQAHGLRRVLIVDYDVHHGNGTQDVFYAEPEVLLVSAHRWPFYPGTGSVEEIGTGEGAGATVNVPLPPGQGDAAFAAIFEQVVWPLARRFAPELILVSAGFDGHWADPLGGLLLTLSGYDHLARELVRLAGALCGGRIVFVLEGGYHLTALAHGVLGLALALLREPAGSDPLPLPEALRQRAARIPPPDDVLARVRRIHGL